MSTLSLRGLRSAELRCGSPEGTSKHQHRGALALTHPQRQGTGAPSRACDTSPNASDISRMAEPAGRGSWRQRRGDGSSSSSVCTEDLAAAFWEGMVEPAVFSEGEEDDALSFPTEDDGDGQDASLSVGPGCPWWDTSPWPTRRESLESLGVRISRLSQISAGTAQGGPCLAPSDGDTGHPWRPPGSSASRSRARTRGHPRSKPTETRHQQPAAVRGWQGGDGALTVEKEGGGSRQWGARCSSHRTEAAAGPSCRCSPHSKVLSFVSCPGGVTQPQWQRGRLAAVLSHKLVSLRRALRRSQERTPELGAGARGTRREGERGSRAGWALLAWTRDQLDLEKVVGTPSWRLHELQNRTRSLLRQRLEALERLRVLLREEEVAELRQLQEATEKRWSQRLRLHSVASPSPSTAPGLRQHGPGSLGLLQHVQRCLQELQVDKTRRLGSLEHPEVLRGELSTAASKEEWGQPGTRDSPSTAASPKQERFLVPGAPRPSRSSRRKHDCRRSPLL
ncbi:uncharacterized protein LOC118174881 isoform X3 [Oxyura jamaicensis]|uniref:uncharacterized protein LOC118174881 isoform X3 n=1 Tax=Oxyura jamaicensis TaxID=8884 RepID=UPI0015A5A2C9|nr:uncharacterized protein LOC118174881 isoform X3 [Oxyura jamaicensis]